MRAWVMGMGLALVTAAGYGPPEAAAGVVINEVLADPAGDADGDGVIHATRDEFIELVNTDAAPVDLAGWTLSDAVQSRHLFSAPSLILPHSFLVVFGSSASSGTLGLNNGGDTITLRDGTLNSIDMLAFGAEGGDDVALTRLPDGDGAFGPHPLIGSLAFSPGKTVGGAAQLPLPDDPGPAPQPPFIPPPDDLPNAPHDPVVPEPSSLWLLGSGLAVLSRFRRVIR